jgi:hypothetical protein
MPTLPLLRTGLAPIAQWLIVPPLAFWLMQRTRTPGAQGAQT